jgi:membrane protein YdbS with pleckstrin-like domain
MEEPSPRRTTNGPQPIHPAIRKVWLFSNTISFVILGIITSVIEFALIKTIPLPWPIPIFMPLFWIGIGFVSANFVKRQWKAWRYEVTDHAIILSHGVLYRTERFVPRDRVQHVDITSGPLARKFGLAHVHLYVAGAHGSVGEIPGLTPDEAENLRSMLVETQAEHV